MRKTYDDEMLQQINENADLFSYAQQTMDIENRGGYYYAHCPKHVDNTPSLLFSKDTNSYHCFSCERSGKMIGFLIDYEGLSFDDAVEKAASIANLDLSKMCKSQTVAFLKKCRNYRLSKQSKHKQDHETIPNTVLSKFSKESAKEWVDEGIKPEVMDLFGVMIDENSNRIVYPVRDIDGRLINIKGRTRYQNYKAFKLPKYTNYYPVGAMDYFQGLDITIPYVRQEKEIIIFESVKSVMKAYGWGYRNCASAEKHTLTPEQIELIIKLNVNVVLAYDSDIDYRNNDVRSNINKLRRITNVYIIDDQRGLLGGASAKNSPADCGLEVWEELYSEKRKVV